MGGLRSAVEEHATIEVADIPTDDLGSVASETAQAIDRLSVHLAQVTDEARRRQVHEQSGFTSVVAWLAALLDWDHAAVKQISRLGKTLHSHSRTAARAAEGAITSARLKVLARAAGRHPEAYRDDEEMLLGFASELELKAFRRAIDHWDNVVDTVRAEDEAFARAERAYLHASSTIDGWVKVDGLLDKERGEVLLTALDAGMMPEARADGASRNLREPSKRRADALVDICRQFLDTYPGVIGGNKPHVSLIVDVPTLKDGDGRISELTFTGTITPETARRILCDSVVTPIICDTEGRPLWLGRSVRTATPAQRRALAVRDGGCKFEGCDRPPHWCDVHHINGFTDWGGRTDIDELELYCRPHHLYVHHLENGGECRPP